MKLLLVDLCNCKACLLHHEQSAVGVDGFWYCIVCTSRLSGFIALSCEYSFQVHLLSLPSLSVWVLFTSV